MLRCDDFDALLGLLRLPLGDPVLGMSVEVLWNLLETVRAEAAAQLAEPGVVGLLTELLQRTLESSHARETDREMRNELVVLGTLLLQGAEAKGRDVLARGGMLGHVIRIVTADPLEASGLAASSAMQLPSAANLELLQLALNFLQVLTTGTH